MAISDRVQEAIAKLAIGDYENAMVQVSIAIDGTAKKRYGSKIGNGERFRRLVQDNQEFIFFIALGCGPRFIFTGNGGFVFSGRGSLAQVLYKYVRNALLHEGDVGDEIVFRHGSIMGHEADRFIVGSELIVGLLLTVIGDPLNETQRLREDIEITVGGYSMRVNSIWGRASEIKQGVGFKAAL